MNEIIGYILDDQDRGERADRFLCVQCCPDPAPAGAEPLEVSEGIEYFPECALCGRQALPTWLA